MMRGLGIAFVAAIAAAALYLAQRPTVARGAAIADLLLDQNRAHGWREIRCDDHIPITVHGARFTCELELDDGDRDCFEVEIDHAGNWKTKVLSSTGPTHRHVPSSGDPWGD